MPFSGRINYSFNKTDSLNESIDFDFYDEPYFDGDRQIGSSAGVRSVEMKPLKNVDLSDRSQNDAIICTKEKTDLLNSSSKQCQDSLTKSETIDIYDSSGDESGIDRSHHDNSGSVSSESSSTPTSDLTSITSRSSISKQSKENSCEDEYKDDFCNTTSESSSENDMQLLTRTVQHMRLNTKYEPHNHLMSHHTVPRQRRVSMTFTNEQVRQINRENDILLRKITANAKPRRNSLATVHEPPKIRASSFVNRSKQLKQIERDNIVLLKRLSEVKPTQKIGCTRRNRLN